MLTIICFYGMPVAGFRVDGFDRSYAHAHCSADESVTTSAAAFAAGARLRAQAVRSRAAQAEERAAPQLCPTLGVFGILSRRVYCPVPVRRRRASVPQCLRLIVPGPDLALTVRIRDLTRNRRFCGLQVGRNLQVPDLTVTWS